MDDDRIDWDFTKPSKQIGSFVNNSVDINAPIKTFSDEQKEESDFTNGPINSTAIDDVEYDPTTNTASVKWINGDKYYDFDVSPNEMRDFAAAPSKGKHVNDIWKNYNRKG